MDSQAFIYTSEELRIAATFCAAELQVSGKIRFSEIGRASFIKFLASAAKSNGASFTPNGAHRRARGLEPRAPPDRILHAMKDMKEFLSSLHLTAWKLGAWPALFSGAQAAISLGWVINFFFSFCRALPERCEIHHNALGSSSEEELGQAKKRKLEGEQSEVAELNK